LIRSSSCGIFKEMSKNKKEGDSRKRNTGFRLVANLEQPKTEVVWWKNIKGREKDLKEGEYRLQKWGGGGTGLLLGPSPWGTLWKEERSGRFRQTKSPNK